MPQSTQTQLGPDYTPTAIKNLIIITCSMSIICALIEVFLNQVFTLPGPQSFLSLSWNGLSHYLLFEPVTSLFVYGIPGQGINFFWLLGLAMNMYILWVMGTNTLERVGAAPFIRMYILSGALAGLFATLIMPLTGDYKILCGPAPSILATLVVWAMLNPNSQLLLFFVLPIKSRWLITILLGYLFISNLSSFDLVSMVFYLGGPIVAYLYAVIAWNLKSPFPNLRYVDQHIIQYTENIKRLLRLSRPKGKIYDIRTGKERNSSTTFMDKMLDKISKHGIDSLTWWERWRMSRISKNKHK